MQIFLTFVTTNNSKKALFLGLLCVFQLKEEPGPPIKPRKLKRLKKKKRQPFTHRMGARENYSITQESGLWEVQHLMNQGPFVLS